MAQQSQSRPAPTQSQAPAAPAKVDLGSLMDQLAASGTPGFMVAAGKQFLRDNPQADYRDVLMHFAAPGPGSHEADRFGGWQPGTVLKFQRFYVEADRKLNPNGPPPVTLVPEPPPPEVQPVPSLAPKPGITSTPPAPTQPGIYETQAGPANALPPIGPTAAPGEADAPAPPAKK